MAIVTGFMGEHRITTFFRALRRLEHMSVGSVCERIVFWQIFLLAGSKWGDDQVLEPYFIK